MHEGVYTMYRQGEIDMRTRVQKWGNSLGIRIPKVLAREVSLEVDSEVDMVSKDGGVMIFPVRRKPPTLRQLLSHVTEDNLHGEIEADGPFGRETW